MTSVANFFPYMISTQKLTELSASYYLSKYQVDVVHRPQSYSNSNSKCLVNHFTKRQQVMILKYSTFSLPLSRSCLHKVIYLNQGTCPVWNILFSGLTNAISWKWWRFQLCFMLGESYLVETQWAEHPASPFLFEQTIFAGIDRKLDVFAWNSGILLKCDFPQKAFPKSRKPNSKYVLAFQHLAFILPVCWMNGMNGWKVRNWASNQKGNR